MGEKDGKVLGHEVLIGEGDHRLNIAVLSDGYTASEMDQYKADAQSFCDTLVDYEPFNSEYVRSALKVHRIDVTSTDSGIKDPTKCGGTGANPTTYFDTTRCGEGEGGVHLERLVTSNDDLTEKVARAQVPGIHSGLLIANSALYGGSGGGNFAVTTKGYNWRGVTIHELGHSIFDLADEYDHYGGCNVSEPTQNVYKGAEPAEANVTIETDRTKIKWRKSIAATTPVPTLVNPDPTQCNTAPDPYPKDSKIGLYEGAYHHHSGVYRSSFTCMMSVKGVDFCPVCQQRIVDVLAPHMGIEYKIPDGKLPDNLEWTAPQKKEHVYKRDFINGRVQCEKWPEFVRTKESIFNLLDFVAEVDFSATPSSGFVQFGMGSGVGAMAPGKLDQNGPHVFSQFAPVSEYAMQITDEFRRKHWQLHGQRLQEALEKEALAYTLAAVGNGQKFPIGDYLPKAVRLEGGVYRAKMRWLKDTKMMTFAIEPLTHRQKPRKGPPLPPLEDYMKSSSNFYARGTQVFAQIDCSKFGFDDDNSNVFFGGGNGATFQNLRIRPVQADEKAPPKKKTGWDAGITRHHW